MIDTGVHIIDMAIYFLGTDAMLASSKTVQVQNWGIEDNASMILQFRSGSAAHLACSYTYALKPQIKVGWEGGWARTLLDGEDQAVTLFVEDSLICRSTGIQTVLVEENDPFKDQIDHFCQCIIDGSSPMIKKEEVLAGHSIVDQVYAKVSA